MRKSGLTGDEAYVLSKHGKTTEDLGPLKKEIGLIKEDIDNLNDKKITKFYASNLGETHITDSDDGKIADMMVYGKSEQKSTMGKNLLKLSEATAYEPYTGGQPSPSPDYPQEIKSVVNPIVKVCGKNLLQPNIKPNGRVKINIKKGTRLTLICKNGVVSQGGNLRFETADGGVEWFGFDAGAVKQQIILQNNAVSFQYLFYHEPSESYALYIGDENTYEPYKEQSVQLPYTLNAIPVSSGGNVTINGQQYVADYVDVERGKIAKMVDSSKLDNAQSIVNKTEWLLAEPQEIDLTQEEVQTLKALATYYPTTNISVISEQLDGYTVFNYPISMANGWNYVKQQLNDNRDYIYDMDTQSAEAYVNSEYAVALTELEV